MRRLQATCLLITGILAACGSPEPSISRSSAESSSAAGGALADAAATNAPAAPESMAMPRDSSKPTSPMSDRLVKTDEEWKALLSPEEYQVARQAGTERAFTGRYWNTKTAGTYKCVCCDTPLFRSDAKFESGCGWPSFFEPLAGANLVELTDDTLGMRRIEVRCKKCDAHLGHVFDDGPPPTGLRYCINSVSLMLDADE